MRRGINSLIGIVKEQMGANVRHSDVFIFIGSGRKLMKLLHVGDGGMVISKVAYIAEISYICIIKKQLYMTTEGILLQTIASLTKTNEEQGR